eukprot:CAMPEP_0201572382 /NCGR_PEP_ID=MMETSP0190_2-20130828/15592_1 /ASSEMBLY_ACC=CAM_ASM_000263 /TAXON_ID=37353 /ORGANISM="Rosalina sp." /LENGTH=288 /DNA_ID=CAMNT_0047998039 /DNA_START=19 /DNA_END=885 /DNA_ORIENTATION=+
MAGVDKAQLRHISALLKEIEIIEDACGGTRGRKSQKAGDEFTVCKLELNETLAQLKQDIKTKKGIEERVGTNTESIKLKNKIKSSLEEAKKLQRKMEGAYKENERDYDNGQTELKSDEIKSRQELVSLMKQDLEYTENEFEPKTSGGPSSGGRGFQLGQQARQKRQKKREQGLMSSEPQPLTAKQQAFIQESIERDAVLDEKLDLIKQGVQQLNAIGTDINEELDKQAVMLDEVEQKMDAVTEKLENRNEQIKKLLESTGGATRWCPVMILCVILLACIGYIWNAFVA